MSGMAMVMWVFIVAELAGGIDTQTVADQQ